jgi:hypothetical protein
MRLACAAAIAAVAAGGLRAGLEDCYVTRTVTVRAYDNADVELGRDDVRDVTLYVFDGEGRFVEAIPTHVGEPVAVTAPAGCDVDLIAWGDLGSGTQDVRGGGAWKGDYSVNLLPDPLQRQGYASPGDLFRGELAVRWGWAQDGGTRAAAAGDGTGTTAPEERAQESGTRAVTVQGGGVTLPMRRAVGSLTVTFRNLAAFVGPDDDLRIVARGTASSIGFDGVAGGDPAAYYPQGSFTEEGDYVVPAFNVIPGADVAIEIYVDGEPVASITENGDGGPISTENGLLTNVLIESGGIPNLYESGVLDVSVSLTPWGVYELWKEF